MQYSRLLTCTVAVAFCCVAGTVFSQQFFSKDTGASAQSTDPVGDINEVAVLYGKFYGFDGRVFGAAMTGVFSVECNLKQNCTSPRAYQGSFQNGPKEYEIGAKQAQQNLTQMQSKGILTPQQYQRFSDALRAGGSDGRLHHLATVWSSLARHAEIHGPFQATYKNDVHRLAGAQLSFQFAMATKYRVLKGTNGGLDGQLTGAEKSAFANNKGQPGSTLRQSIETITGSFKDKIDRGAKIASQQTSVAISQYNPSSSFFSNKDNAQTYAAVTNTTAYTPQSSPGVVQSPGAAPWGQQPQPGTDGSQSQAQSQQTGVGAGSIPPQSEIPSQYADPSLQRYASDDVSIATLSCSKKAKLVYACDSTVSSHAVLTSVPQNTRVRARGMKGTIAIPDKKAVYKLQCFSSGVLAGETECEYEPHSVPKLQKVKPVATGEDTSEESILDEEHIASFVKKSSQTGPRRGSRAVSMHVEAEPKNVTRGATYHLSWVAVGVEQCVMHGPNLTQSGFLGDREVRAERSGNVRYTLTCKTAQGGVVSRSVSVHVR